MKKSVLIMMMIWMALAVVNFVSLISAPCLIFTICNWLFAVLNATVFASFVGILIQEFKGEKIEEPVVVEEPIIEEVPTPKKKRAKKSE